MTAKTSVEKKSVGPNKRASKRAPPPKELRARSSRLTRDFQLGGDDARAPPLGSTAPLAERVQALRGQLFKAISIVECCKFATATLLVVDDAEYMVPAFEAICDLIDTSAEELEKIASECASAA
jgi:hypothetical protein